MPLCAYYIALYKLCVLWQSGSSTFSWSNGCCWKAPWVVEVSCWFCKVSCDLREFLVVQFQDTFNLVVDRS